MAQQKIEWQLKALPLSHFLESQNGIAILRICIRNYLKIARDTRQPALKRG
jgi:hypothetical protein